MSYIGNQPTTVAFLTDTFSGNGSTTAFTMQVAPATTSSVLVAITGVVQDPSTYAVSGTTLTFSAAPPTGTSNISVRYLGIPASGVTTTAYRTVTEFTATAGQTTFSVPSYTVGYIDVYRNGSRLGAADYTATTGTSVVLAAAASAGDLVTTESFYVSSVLNAIPATAGAISLTSATYLSGVLPVANGGTGLSAGGPAFSAYKSAAQTLSSATFTKITFDTEEYDTNNNFLNSTFTPTVAGYYQVNGALNNGTATQTLPIIYKNGSAFKTGTNYSAYAGVVTATIYCNGSTDYLELYGYFASGTATGSGAVAPYFQACMIRGA